MNYATGNRRTTWNRECEEYVRGQVFKIEVYETGSVKGSCQHTNENSNYFLIISKTGNLLNS